MQAEMRIKPWSCGISKLSEKLSKFYPQATGSTQECGASTLIVLFSRSPSRKNQISLFLLVDSLKSLE